MEQQGLTLYQQYDRYFDGGVVTDSEMEALLKGLEEETAPCYVFKVGNTYCGVVYRNSSLQVLFHLQYSDKDTKYHQGRFVKKIQYQIASKGYNIKQAVFVVWGREDISPNLGEYVYHIQYLQEQLSQYSSLREFYHTINYEIEPSNNISASQLVYLLNLSADLIGMHIKNGVFAFRRSLFKDYTLFSYDFTNRRIKPKYGVILDCEGVKGTNGSLSNGCSEIGGLIYVKADRKLFIVETFKAERELIPLTLKEVSKRYTMLAGGRKVPVLIFGASDVPLLQASCSRGILNAFKFNNCMNFVHKYLGGTGKVQTLSGYCREHGIMYKKPLHDPLNDAKTLFNVLAYIAEKHGGLI